MDLDAYADTDPLPPGDDGVILTKREFRVLSAFQIPNPTEALIQCVVNLTEEEFQAAKKRLLEVGYIVPDYGAGSEGFA